MTIFQETLAKFEQGKLKEAYKLYLSDSDSLQVSFEMFVVEMKRTGIVSQQNREAEQADKEVLFD